MKARVTQPKRPKRHAPNKTQERWNDKGEINKGPTTGNGVGASSLEIRELEIFPSRLHCGHVFEPKLNAQQDAICEAFFFEML